ncbi:MAG TPA: hypothetical protein VMU07_04115 [Candidatus Paceibacterota bacterium]|nr:hypothetical protein [Candidatus Paceibacterota bacterium]
MALAFVAFSAATSAHAAGPQFFITWKASGSYAPSGFSGKVLPTYGSQITASLELISGGVPLDLSGQKIFWYVNETLIGGGLGAQSITFPPIGQAPTSMTLKVELPSYRGATLIKTILIPMVPPQVVLVAPYPGGQFSANPVTLTAIPYFFNVTSSASLSYRWTVNGQSSANAENPQIAQVALPNGTAAGTSFPISVTISNAKDSTQAVATQNLVYQPSL